MGEYQRVILVTGSNSGIGYELVRLLASKGHIVYLASRNPTAGGDAQATVKKEHDLDVNLVQLEVTELDSIKAAEKFIEEIEGRLDVLVNNAACCFIDEPQSASTIDLALLRSIIETNFYGLVQTTATFLPLLRKAPKGHAVILNVSSGIASTTLQANQTIQTPSEVVGYRTSKAAVNSYTIALAHELRKEGIKVNSISPGLVSTKMNNYIEGGRSPEEGANVLVPWTLLGPGDEDKTGMFCGANGKLPW